MVDQIAEAVAGLFGVHTDRLHALNRFFYCYEDSGTAYIARVLDSPEDQQQLIEVTWINFLVDHGVGIARAVPSINGCLVEKISIGETPLFVVSLERAEGSPPTMSEWNPELFRKLGA